MSLGKSSASTDQTTESLVEHLNATLVEILRQQNERIIRLETEHGGVVRSAIDQKENESTGGTVHRVSEAKEQQQLDLASFDMDEYATVMTVWPDPGQALVINTSSATSWHTTSRTQYMEPSPLPFVTPSGGIFDLHPEWKSWFRSKLWIPADRRLQLAFDVDHLNQCETVNQAVSKYKALHDFDERLCNNGGRLLIIDNDTFLENGENRLCGNLVEKGGWREGFLSNWYSLHCDNDGNRLTRMIDQHGLKEIPLMTWTTIDGTIAGTRPAAPWRRLIIIEGLVGARFKNNPDPELDHMISSLWAEPHSIASGYGLTMKKFLKASTQSFSARDGYHFQYSWFFSTSVEQIGRWNSRNTEIYEQSQTITDPEKWDASYIRLLKFGRLYGSSKSMIARDAYYFRMIFSESTDDDSEHGMNNYWSALVFRRPSSKSNASMLPIFHAQLQVLSNSNEALSSIIDDSTEIVDHIGCLLDIGDEVLLDPDRHDELLFDDEVFSRSRTYWWTLNMLTAMQQSLTETLTVRQEMWDTVIEPLVYKDAWPLGTEAVFRKDKTLVREFAKLKDRITQQHQRAEALRSGLFNASGVVESRASTRLGEIVKLLTYVSIFFLPLSFSTSLWSTTDQIRNLNTAIMFGVMIGLGVLTYAVVFNLNNLIRSMYQYYESAKLPWTKKMYQSGGKWKDRALRYSGFKIMRLDTSPSEWLLIWYIITWPVRRFLGLKNTQIVEEQTTSQLAREKKSKSTRVDNSNEGWLTGHPPFPPLEDTLLPLKSSSSKSKIPQMDSGPASSSRFNTLFGLLKLRQRDDSVTKSAPQQASMNEV